MLNPEVVAREAAAWVWYPDDAAVVETDDFLLVRCPDYFGKPPDLLRVAATADARAVVDAAVAQASAWGGEALTAWVRLDAPAGLEETLVASGFVPEETVDVFALDPVDGTGVIQAPDVDLAWRDADNSRDHVEVSMVAFGEGSMPDPDTLRRLGGEAQADRLAGRGCQLIAYGQGCPIGAAGLTFAGSTARLWGAGVIPEARGRGVYRALLRARLDYATEHGATLALVKGRIETSGPILRRVGFATYGQERSYRLSLRAGG